MGTAFWISLGVVVLLVVLLALYLWVTYNSLVTLRARVDEAWRDITVQQQRRAELVPELLETIRGYAPHEKAVFDSVDSAREETLAADNPADATVAENHMQQALRSAITVAEAFPQLHASERFLQLQGDLVDTEEKLQGSRRFYNGGVREFNNRIQTFPNRLFTRRPGFGRRDFFETSDVTAIAQPPRIQF